MYGSRVPGDTMNVGASMARTAGHLSGVNGTTMSLVYRDGTRVNWTRIARYAVMDRSTLHWMHGAGVEWGSMAVSRQVS